MVMSRDIEIQLGDTSDYEALARHHYRSAAPATCVRVLAAHQSRGRVRSEPIGVLTVSMPALNGPWRTIAWPEVFAGEPFGRSMRRASLQRLNRDVRVISRVIVAPPWRGRGIGARLVRAYLADPCTSRTEAVAAMGAFCPLFAVAGMRGIEYPPSRRVVRLIARMRELGIETWRLADPASLTASLDSSRRAELKHHLRVFAGAHRDTRGSTNATLEALIELAARRVNNRPVAFVADRTHIDSGVIHAAHR